jgi:uncharacterized membrane protein
LQSLSWILWNLFLSAIPVGLVYLWTYGIQRYSLKRKGIPWIVFTPFIVLWILFLPNTCYLLTEWRHFLFDPHYVGLREAVESNRALMLRVARQGLFFLCYSGFGVLCLLYAIRPAEQLLTRLRVQKPLWMAPLFLLTSLGVYLGLIVRLNSWDFATRPAHVWRTTWVALASPRIFETIVIFAVLLWLCYEIASIWADGLALRLKKRRQTG